MIPGKGAHKDKDVGFAFLILSHLSEMSHENEMIWSQ